MQRTEERWEINIVNNNKKCRTCLAKEKLGELEKIFGTVENLQYEEYEEWKHYAVIVKGVKTQVDY